MKTKLIAVQIPAKYKWRAIDADGARYVYTLKPQLDAIGWRIDYSKEDYLRIGQGSICPNWQSTLERIVEIEWS